MPVNDKVLRVMILNGLVMPGAGHIYLKQKTIGSAIGVIFSISAITAIAKFALFAFSFFVTLLDFIKIDIFVFKLWADPLFKYSMILAIAIWIGALIDGYRLAVKE